MNFIEQASRNKSFAPLKSDTDGVNYYAFFDKPTPENLAANHGGILTMQQQEALERIIANQKLTTVIFSGMSICSVLFISFLFWKIDALDGVISFHAQLINAAVMILVFGLFVGFLIGDWVVFFAGNDLANGAVESDVGRIEWSGKRYQMRTDHRLLRSLRSRVNLPPPGQYRFYYLPHTGLVVMAEETGIGNTDAPMPPLLQALASANGFSHGDLIQNQNGTLTVHQENRLLLWVLFFGLVFLACTLLVVSIGSKIISETPTVTYVLILVIAVVLMLKIGWSIGQAIVDIWRGKVVSIEGRVMREIRHARYSRSYYYLTHSHRFKVSKAAYDALIEGNSYRIYYVPRSRRLVSIEPL